MGKGDGDVQAVVSPPLLTPLPPLGAAWGRGLGWGGRSTP